MPRQLRIEYEGAKYHVMARGDRREAIFRDDEDRRNFLKTLGEACERTGWRVFAWVLMGNHYHMVVETPEANLVKGMQWLQTTWTVRYNRRHGLAGHLFGGRYKAVVVESDLDAPGVRKRGQEIISRTFCVDLRVPARRISGPRMPRQLRIEYEGAKYHVMARGDRREAIFRDDEDRRNFLKTLGEACERTGWRVFAWVLMGNHYHMVVETPEANLVKGMQWFQTTWTVRYNRRHGLAGHLFGGRYKAVVVESDLDAPEAAWRMGGYIGAVIDYVHLNPVRARMVTPGSEDGLLSYEWSSLAMAYAVEARKRPPWMDAARGLSFLGFEDRARGRRGYLEYLENRMREEETERCGAELPGGQTLQSTLRRGWYFGSQGFREELFKRIAGPLKRRGRKRESYEGAAAQRSHGEAEAERLIEQGMRWLGVGPGEAGRQRGDRLLHLLAKLVRERTTARNEWIAQRLSLRSAGNVSHQLYRLRQALKDDEQLKSTWNQLTAKCEQ